MIRIRQLKILVNNKEDNILKKKCAKKLGISDKDIKAIKIIKRSIDARNKPDIYYSYIVDVKVKDEKYIIKKKYKDKDVFYVDKDIDKYVFVPSGKRKIAFRPIVVGMGPSGLIVGYMLAKYGYNPLIIERGNDVDKRVKDIEEFWNSNKLNTNSNVQFGEGGAGTFSDGKLNTRIKDKNNYQKMVFDIFVENGAPEEIRYVNDPHIGTDNLRKIVKNIRNKIIDMGGKIRFNTCLTDIEIKDNMVSSITVNENEKIHCNVLILAIGHSARDTFKMLHSKNINMESKPFAVGVRIIHPQKLINKNQYGVEKSRLLKAASYKLTYKAKSGRGVYTFCMCPGGYVINASSEENGLCVNGMSNYKRNSECANSAVVATVDNRDYGDDVLDGMMFQQEIEKRAYAAGKGVMPISLLRDYNSNTISSSFGKVIPAIKGRYMFANLDNILPDDINDSIKEAICEFNNKIDGFSSDDSVIAGVETRTSSPVRIIRDESHEACVKGLYPCGEGSGYAGGIVSSAVDGLITFEKIADVYMG
ncbi:MAG: FAD-dependent oxidoreductase [Bacilli bacterium]|nr:FAD-dependent oxidoreductase [Bacilli bacterium]